MSTGSVGSLAVLCHVTASTYPHMPPHSKTTTCETTNKEFHTEITTAPLEYAHSVCIEFDSIFYVYTGAMQE